MDKNNIKMAVIFLLIIPIVISIVLSCTNFSSEPNYGSNANMISDDLYIPDTLKNREKHVIKKTDFFTYTCIFGLLSLFGITYVYMSNKKG